MLCFRREKGSSSFVASSVSAEGLSGNVSLFSSVCSSFREGGSEGGDGVVSTPEVSSRSGSDAVSKFSMIGPRVPARQYATMIVPEEEDDDLIDETVNGLMTVKDRCATDNEILLDNGYLQIQSGFVA
jgi:hypothetical protein